MIKFTGPEDRIIRFTEKGTDRVTDKVTVRLTEKETELLRLLSEDPGYTYPQLAEKMDVSRKSVADYIKNLKDKGAIERVGSDRNGYWKIKL